MKCLICSRAGSYLSGIGGAEQDGGRKETPPFLCQGECHWNSDSGGSEMGSWSWEGWEPPVRSNPTITSVHHNLCPQVPHPHIFWTLPPLSWAVPMFCNPFLEGIFPNIWFKPSLTQLEAISSTVTFGKKLLWKKLFWKHKTDAVDFDFLISRDSSWLHILFLTLV